MVTPHDDLFHFSFQQLRHAAAWLRWLLPAAVARAIEWASLRPAPEKLRGHAPRLSVADLVLGAKRCGDLGPVWFVVEHKAHRDPEVERQLLRYAVHLGDRARGDLGPAPVVAVLLHHGDQPFLGGAPAGDDPFAAWQPQLRFIVDDLQRETEASLRARRLTPLGTLTLLCLRFLRGQSGAETLQSFERWGDLLRAVDRDDGPRSGRDAIAAIACYALCVVEVPHRDLHEAFERLLQRPEETIMSTAEKLRREGFAQGRAEGEAMGRAETLLRQLEKRFGALPAGTAERVRASTIADLDRWLDRVLDARALADVFA